MFINQSDVVKDLVFRRAAPNERSLSGVLAHEVTHLWMRKRFGYWRYLFIPTWKKEGFAEYVAGGSPTSPQYAKYYRVVRYLLEHDKLSVEALVDGDFDLQSLEARVLE